jgi:hypothetical protein
MLLQELWNVRSYSYSYLEHVGAQNIKFKIFLVLSLKLCPFNNYRVEGHKEEEEKED